MITNTCRYWYVIFVEVLKRDRGNPKVTTAFCKRPSRSSLGANIIETFTPHHRSVFALHSWRERSTWMSGSGPTCLLDWRQWTRSACWSTWQRSLQASCSMTLGGGTLQRLIRACFCFFVLSSGFCLVLALVARVCYCLFFCIIRFVISTFTPIFFIEISFVFGVVNYVCVYGRDILKSVMTLSLSFTVKSEVSTAYRGLWTIIVLALLAGMIWIRVFLKIVVIPKTWLFLWPVFHFTT